MTASMPMPSNPCSRNSRAAASTIRSRFSAAFSRRAPVGARGGKLRDRRVEGRQVAQAKLALDLDGARAVVGAHQTQAHRLAKERLREIQAGHRIGSAREIVTPEAVHDYDQNVGRPIHGFNPESHRIGSPRSDS